MTRLPPELVALLDGNELDSRVGLTLELLTTGEDGWPRAALLSVGEVLCLDEARLRFALWPASQTTANLTRSRRAVLAFVHAGGAYALRLEACRGADLVDPVLAVFDAAVVELRRDEVPYARLTGGISFELEQRAAVLERWHSTLAALRGHPGCRGLAA